MLRIVLGDQPVEESDEDKLGVILDYDADGNIVDLEILDVSRRGLHPLGVEYTVTGLTQDSA